MDTMIKNILLERKIKNQEYKISESEKETILNLSKAENINEKNDKFGCSYLHMVVSFEDWELIDIFLKIENINLLVVDKNDLNILLFAIEKNKNILKLLECLEKYNNQYVVQKLLFYKNKQN